MAAGPDCLSSVQVSRSSLHNHPVTLQCRPPQSQSVRQINCPGPGPSSTRASDKFLVTPTGAVVPAQLFTSYNPSARRRCNVATSGSRGSPCGHHLACVHRRSYQKPPLPTPTLSGVTLKVHVPRRAARTELSTPSFQQAVYRDVAILRPFVEWRPQGGYSLAANARSAEQKRN
eukprot:2709638-Amphidinium_carterae.1